MMKPSAALRKLIDRSGRSASEIAEECGYSHPSGLQRYTSDEFKGKYFRVELVEKLAKALVGYGDPPVTAEEVYALAGVAVPLSFTVKHRTRPNSVPSDSDLSLAVDLDSITFRYIDLRPAAGPNGAVLDVMRDRLDEITIGHYSFPRQGFREQFGAEPGGILIVEIVGDSMIPTLMPGQRVMVDTMAKSPSPAGIFLVWDGLSEVVKRVEYLAHSSPATVRIISDNAKYQPYERQLDEAHIQGRVIGGWSRM